MAFMFGQDVGAMIEARNAREWEELNAEPEMPVSDIDTQLSYAWSMMSKAYSRLANAANYADGFPLADRIESVMYDLENLQIDVEKFRKEVKSA